MNDRLIYLPITGYLREWVIHHFGNPAVFPKRSFENTILQHYMIVPPHNAKPVLPSDDLLCISVPVLQDKHWDSYNYLSHEGVSALKEDLTYLLELDLHPLIMTIHLPGIGERIEEWCIERHISLDHFGSVKKRFYRLRRRYDENHIVLGRRYNKR